MDIVTKIMGIAFIGAVLSVLLKEKTPHFSITVSLATGIVIFALIAERMSFALNHMETVISQTGMEASTVNLILKICGIGMVSEYFCNVIADSGETAIAKKAEMASKIVIFIMILPLVEKVVETVWSFF